MARGARPRRSRTSAPAACTRPSTCAAARCSRSAASRARTHSACASWGRGSRPSTAASRTSVKTMVRTAWFDHHPRVLVCDVERRPLPEEHLRAEFCHHVGVLYHLADPVTHLFDLGRLISTRPAARHALRRRRRRPPSGTRSAASRSRYQRYGEFGYEDAWSGMFDHSKWLTLDTIVELLRRAGFDRVLSSHDARRIAGPSRAHPRGALQLVNASRRRRWALRVVALVGFVALIGVTYQGVATALERRAYPRPGRMVDVGGHQLHIACDGQGAPTVVLDAPAAGLSAAWGRVQPAVARTTRVCSYDRAGLGWSEAREQPFGPDLAVEELQRLLAGATEPRPFVLVGQGLGASLAQAFAGRFPGGDGSARAGGPAGGRRERRRRDHRAIPAAHAVARACRHPEGIRHARAVGGGPAGTITGRDGHVPQPAGSPDAVGPGARAVGRRRGRWRYGDAAALTRPFGRCRRATPAASRS